MNEQEAKQGIREAIKGVEEHFISEHFKDKEIEKVLLNIHIPDTIQKRIPSPFAHYCFRTDMEEIMEKFASEIEYQLNLNGVFYKLQEKPLEVKMTMIFPEDIQGVNDEND